MIYEQTTLKNLQNIDRNKTVKFGVTEVEMSGSECKKKTSVWETDL